MTEYPGAYLIRWCYNLPAGFGVALAHLYLISTSQDMAPLFLDTEGIWREFQNKLMKEDIPLRMAVRHSSAMATLGFILGCLSEGSERTQNAFPISLDHLADQKARAQVWRELTVSFGELSDKLCGQEHTAGWLLRTLNPEG
jgi:hypothetical protein